MQRAFFRSLLLLITLNLLIKPVWVFGIDRQVQNITGFDAYGKYFALLNLTMVLNFILDLGITSYFNQTVASSKQLVKGFYSKVVVTKILLSVVFTVVVFIIAKLSGITDWKLLSLLVVMQILTTFLLLIRSYLTATQQFGRDAVLSVIDKLLVIINVGLLIYNSSMGEITIFRFVSIQVFALLVATLVGLSFTILRFKFDFHHTRISAIGADVISPSIPFAMTIFFMSLLTRGDSFLLERLHPEGALETGIYASAFRLLDALNMVGFLFVGFLVPYIARHQSNDEHVHSTLLACRDVLLLFAVFAAAFVLAAPHYVIKVLYHRTDPYVEKVAALTLLSLPSLSIVHIYGTALTATGKVKVLLRIAIVFATISFLANLIFAGKYGALACSTIACCTQAVFAFTVMFFSRKYTGVPIHFLSLMGYAIAGVAFWAIVRGAEYLGWNIPAVAIIAGIIIVTLLFVTGRISLKQVLEPVTEK